MGAFVTAILLATACLTALLSGIFGMAGGLVLMGVLALFLPVAAAYVTHGIQQMAANGWRAILHRAHIDWAIVANYALASVVAAALVSVIAFVPAPSLLYLLLGLVAMLVWLPKDRFHLDAARPWHARASGFLVTALNLSAGVAGPLLDIFFVRTELTRHQIVATKAATQVLSHLAKIIVYGLILADATRGLDSVAGAMPPLWFFLMALPLSALGTVAGGRILDRFSDAGFRRATAWIVTLIGLAYLVRSLDLLIA